MQLDKLNAENATAVPSRPDSAVPAAGVTTVTSAGGTASAVNNGAPGAPPVAASVAGSEAATFAPDENSQGTLGGGDDEATNDTAVSVGAANAAVDCTGCGQLARDPVRCSDCPKAGHARCMELPEHMREAIRR